MNYFIASLPTPIGVVEFIFNRIATPSAAKYHVSVNDEEGQSYSFTMETQNGKWRIINAPKVPTWIMATEVSLSNAINSKQGD